MTERESDGGLEGFSRCVPAVSSFGTVVLVVTV